MAKQGTLLVVDDNRNILTSLQYLLEEYFQQVITLNSPVTIPSLLQREAIDVVLLVQYNLPFLFNPHFYIFLKCSRLSHLSLHILKAQIRIFVQQLL